MRRREIGMLFATALVIYTPAAEISAKDTYKRTIGGHEQIASLGSTTVQPNASSMSEMSEFKQDLKDDRLTAKMHHDRGVDYAKHGQYDLALSEFNAALEIYPSSAETYNNRGITYSKKGDLDHAISDFTRALTINPYSAKAYHNRGITFVIRGQIDLALSDLEKCRELDPTNVAIYESIGVILVGLACPYWERACQLGHCDVLEKAVNIGLCVAAPGK